MTSIKIAVTPTQVEAARAIVRRDRAKGIETDRAILTIAAATSAGIEQPDIEADRPLVRSRPSDGSPARRLDVG